ncbi:MAG: hypothetical protein QM831_32645 [Kofleriaceae bacterium]
MRVILWVTFALGSLVGLVAGIVVFFWWSLIRGKRAVHAIGVVTTAKITGTGFLDGDATVRFAGAFYDQEATHDILGLDIRIAPDATHPKIQDITLGTFESFHTAPASMKTVDTGDVLANKWSSVTPYWTTGKGAVVYHLIPPPAGDPKRGTDRLSRLLYDLEHGTASFQITANDAPIGSLQLIARIDPAHDDAAERVSMFNCGRGMRPIGFRNGLRAPIYPISQLARRIRGG